MNSRLRTVVGLVVLLFAVFFTPFGVFAVVAAFERDPLPTEFAAMLIGLPVFSWALALVYLAPLTRPVTLRILGAVLLLSVIGNFVRAAWAGLPDAMPGFLFSFACIGIPGVYFLVFGRLLR